MRPVSTAFPIKEKNRLHGSFQKAPIRIELMNNGFADRSLTTWAWRHNAYTLPKKNSLV